MATSIRDEIKGAFSKKDNAHVQFAIVNLAIFLVIIILQTVFKFTKVELINTISSYIFTLPGDISSFLFRPWTIITYAFAHVDFWSILYNVLFMYWFGKLIVEYVGARRFINLYVMGGIAGALVFLLVNNLIPDYALRNGGVVMMGAKASVLAVVAGTAVLLPDLSLRMVFIGSVRLKYIAGAVIAISLLNKADYYTGVGMANLSGALFGLLFVWQLQKGNDMGRPLSIFFEAFTDMFNKKSKIKVTHRGEASSKSFSRPSQGEIDKILDKIAKSGYDSLTKGEKETLFKASD